MPEKKVTIITPVKNILSEQMAERFLNCVSSVASQTYQPIEHLVIDGNSDDGTAVILTTQPSIRYEVYPSKNKEDAMNYGVSKAQGDYILFLNAGDVLLEDTAIEKMVKTLEENNADFVYGPSIYENPMGNKNKEDCMDLYFFSGQSFRIQSCLLKKEIFEKIGNFNTSIEQCSANEFIVRMFINGFSGARYDNPLVSFYHLYVSPDGRNHMRRETLEFLKVLYKDFPAYTEEKIRGWVEHGLISPDLYVQVLDKAAPVLREKLKNQLQALTEKKDVWPEFFEKGYRQLYIPLQGIGDALTFQAVTKALFEKTGHKILVGHKDKSLFENNPYVEVISDIYDAPSALSDVQVLKIEQAGLEIVFPCYYPLKKASDDRYDHFYPNCHLIARIAEICGLNCKIDLKPALFLTEEEKKFGRFAPQGKKQVAIMSGAHEKYKYWPHFQEVVDALKDEVYFVQIGAKSDDLLNGVSKVLNGEISLRQTAAVLHNSDLFVGEIGGLMHMARAVDCPAVIAYSSVEPDYFVNYIANTNVHPKEVCHESYTTGIRNACVGCLNRFKCIKSIDVKEVVEAVREKLKNPSPRPLPVETVEVKSDFQPNSIQNFYKRHLLDKE